MATIPVVFGAFGNVIRRVRLRDYGTPAMGQQRLDTLRLDNTNYTLDSTVVTLDRG